MLSGARSARRCTACHVPRIAEPLAPMMARGMRCAKAAPIDRSVSTRVTLTGRTSQDAQPTPLIVGQASRSKLTLPAVSHTNSWLARSSRKKRFKVTIAKCRRLSIGSPQSRRGVSSSVPGQVNEWLLCGVVQFPSVPPHCAQHRSSRDVVMMKYFQQWDVLTAANRLRGVADRCILAKRNMGPDLIAIECIGTEHIPEIASPLIISSSRGPGTTHRGGGTDPREMAWPRLQRSPPEPASLLAPSLS